MHQDIPQLVPIFGIMVDDQRYFWMRLQISHPGEIFRWHSLWLAVECGKELALVKDKTYRQHVRLAVRLDGGQTRHSCFSQLQGDGLWNFWWLTEHTNRDSLDGMVVLKRGRP